MSEILVVGGGMAGQTAAMLLAKDGHAVTVLERDAEAPPTSVDEAWAHWERRGVNQFRMLHFFLPRFREVLAARAPRCDRRHRRERRVALQPHLRDARRILRRHS